MIVHREEKVIMGYKQSQEWQKYCTLIKARPEAFRNNGSIDIITDINKVEKFVEATGKKVGVIYYSSYNLWVVDLVKSGDRYYTYERLLPAVERGAVVTIPKFGEKYVLLKQYRHALRDYQYAFPRGFGEKGIAAESNAGKEIAEELGTSVVKSKFLGQVIADSGCCGNSVDIYVCDILEPQIQMGYEGIQGMVVIEESELKQWIGSGKITDGFTLSAWALLQAQRTK